MYSCASVRFIPFLMSFHMVLHPSGHTLQDSTQNCAHQHIEVVHIKYFVSLTFSVQFPDIAEEFSTFLQQFTVCSRMWISNADEAAACFYCLKLGIMSSNAHENLIICNFFTSNRTSVIFILLYTLVPCLVISFLVSVYLL